MNSAKRQSSGTLMPPGAAITHDNSQSLAWQYALACVLLMALYLLARLPALLVLPLFNDEAVYLLRGQRFPSMLADTLGDGKLIQELLLAALVRLPGDPLLFSRLLSVISGGTTLAGLLVAGRIFGRPGAGLLAGLLYIGAPIAALHDRLGLPDSMLTTVACFIVLASIEFARTPRPTRKSAMLIGVLIGFASMVKLPGLFLLCIPVLAVLMLSGAGADRHRRLALLRWAAIMALACIAALAPMHYGGNERGKTDFISLADRAALLAQNLWLIGVWLVSYLPAPLLALPLAVFALARRTASANRRMIAFLLAASLAIHAIFLGVGTTLYPRYLMPAWPALLLASALAAAELWRMVGPMRWVGRAIGVAVLGVTLAWDGFFAIQLQRDPAAAPLVARDRLQYLETWTAGYTLPEIINLVQQHAGERNGITLVGYDRPRLIHMAPLIYLRGDPLVRFEMLDLGSADAPEQMRQLAAQRPVYLLLDEQENQVLDIPRRFQAAQLRRVFENPLGTMRFYLYEQPHPYSGEQKD